MAFPRLSLRLQRSLSLLPASSSSSSSVVPGVSGNVWNRFTTAFVNSAPNQAQIQTPLPPPRRVFLTPIRPTALGMFGGVLPQPRHRQPEGLNPLMTLQADSHAPQTESSSSRNSRTESNNLLSTVASS